MTSDEARRAAHILLVDDHADQRAIYGTILRHCGFRVTEAASGEDGVRAALADPPALVLMDAAMPGMDGWTAIEQLRQSPDMAGTHMVMLTAHVLREHRARAEALGVVRFVAKPCPPRDLVRVVDEVLATPAVRAPLVVTAFDFPRQPSAAR